MNSVLSEDTPSTSHRKRIKRSDPFELHRGILLHPPAPPFHQPTVVYLSQSTARNSGDPVGFPVYDEK